jgi:hypothetical protein
VVASDDPLDDFAASSIVTGGRGIAEPRGPMKSPRPGIRWTYLALPLVAVVAALVARPRSTTANVSPVTLIERQIHKPNMLIVLDTSGSMAFAPGSKENYSSDVGMDCDGDSWCNNEGTRYRCVLGGSGTRGADAWMDTTSCSSNADCAKGICWNPGVTACTSDSGCATGEFCSRVPNDRCILTTGLVRDAKVCRIGLNRCWDNTDCTAYAGDTCGPGVSRMVIVKRVLASVVGDFFSTVNFGLMTFYQTFNKPTATPPNGYYPYYPVSGSITNNSIDRFMDKDQLEAAGCWTKNGGPASSCQIETLTFNRRGSVDSRYRIKTGADSYTITDSNWCGLYCSSLPVAGTGYYVGSFYVHTDPQAAISSTTPIIRQTYGGKVITVGTTKYVYWNPPESNYALNGTVGDMRGCATCGAGTSMPIQGGTPSTCSATTGGNWNVDMVPFMDTSNDLTKARSMAMAIMARMDKARYGGLAAAGGTPMGCTLWNNYTGATEATSAFHYMQKVKGADSLDCRNNHVLLVTDGAPYQSPDLQCDSTACASTSLTGCNCHAVKAAKMLKDNDISVYVIGMGGAFSASAGSSGTISQKTLNNIAKAGGTSTAYFAIAEDQLKSQILNIIYDVAKGNYSTSPAVASASGTMLLDTRVDFPDWKGNLIAYDVTTTPPSVAWNAATVSFDPATAGADFWKKRNVWTSSGTTMVKIQVDQATGAITNKAELKTLGLGATDAEAELVARWMLGDPALGNTAVLGALVNSTPIDIGPPLKNDLPGGAAFVLANANRPSLIYVGSSSGMLHAFFSKSVTVGGVNYKAGQEAFAYIPQTFLGVNARLFAQNGQRPDPRDHLYGLANSAKVKDVCVEDCAGTGTPVWKSILVMTYGFGGTEAFTMDITNPFDSGGVKTSTAPAPVIWNSQYLSPSQTSAYDNALGLTTSVPVFSYAKSATKDDFRLTFGSYYTDAATGSVAKVLMNARLPTGEVLDSETVNPGNSCPTQEYGLLSDVASARNYNIDEETQVLAMYFGDTWGNLYRYVPDVGGSNYTQTTGSASLIESYGCQHPIHFTPTVVQLDREIRSNRPGEIYLVQVTNSALDPDTKDYAASKIVFRRDIGNLDTGTVTSDSAFTKIELTAGTSALCGVTNAAGTSCTQTLPASARPASTPTAILRADGNGFQVVTTWYEPAADGCTKGTTYLTLHEVLASAGTVTQKLALKLANEPISAATFVGGKLYYATEAGVTDLTSQLPPSVSFTRGKSGGFRRTGWSEKP